MMTDLLVRLFCHTHTCHNLAMPCLGCATLLRSVLLYVCMHVHVYVCFFAFVFVLPFVFRLFLRNDDVVVVVVVGARSSFVHSFEIYLALAKRRRLIGFGRC